MKSIIFILLIFQFNSLKESKQLSFFYVSTSCYNSGKDDDHLEINFYVGTSGFTEPVEFELKFTEQINITANCIIPPDQSSQLTSNRYIRCNISIIEYGIDYSLKLPKEPPYIEDVETRNWESIAGSNLVSECTRNFTYVFNYIKKASVYCNKDYKILNIKGTIRKKINITGEEKTVLNIKPYFNIDNINKYLNCNLTFNGLKDMDENSDLKCSITEEGNVAYIIKSIPYEHNKNYYVSFDCSNLYIIHLDECYSFSSSILLKFWLSAIILFMF